MFLVFPRIEHRGSSTRPQSRKRHTFDHSSMSISPAVVSMITRPLVGKAMMAFLKRNKYKRWSRTSCRKEREGTGSRVAVTSLDSALASPPHYLVKYHHHPRLFRILLIGYLALYSWRRRLRPSAYVGTRFCYYLALTVSEPAQQGICCYAKRAPSLRMGSPRREEYLDM